KRQVLATARRAAAQARAGRVQSRAEAFLPGRSVGMPRAGFAPVQGGPMVPAGVLRPRRLAVTEERLTPSPEVITRALGGGRREAHMAGALAALARQGAAPAVMPAAPMAGGGSRPEPVVDERDLAQALRAYFFRQSRLPPAGAAGFDPRLTPAWAGIKIPG
ncbi:hypothetical protein, partial [Acidocella sp. KAb 2-4]|uniref:hypothetical protein n=1 Tax=Acidocella sp. KAb 2-4 TaxID=2885158 RepID=UPI001D0768F0